MRNFLMVLALSISTASYAASLQSGIYEGLQLAVSPTGDVTGYYSETLGQGVTRNCSFALAGKVNAVQEADIRSWSSDVLPGHIAATKNGVVLRIPQGQSHDGCINVMVPLIDEGLELERTRQTRWLSMAEVSGERVYLSNSPDVATRRKAWLVKGDVVGVVKNQSGWTQIEFVSESGKTTAGWVESSKIKPLTPPAA
ncbi:hypothetical protein GA0061071_103182 [Kosakonia oryzendophytica]|uniref:SH3 domain-containing protein n=1 Tax=Kosakonia oryzendophytica TaxID=1005665 RepID=A0A1C4AMI5_9ENTR|nr:hypothetical protein [Kosakonia oryzendophytica]SCB95854.1 hypothetical protein GA0061071_103182 [Kosakonia oryzendophytica]